MIATEVAAAYQQPAEAVIAALDSNAAHGLTTDDARRRLDRYGPNELATEPRITAWRKSLA
jgi:Ca2+-transporting ATPase